jgi:hypothetical protein
VLFCENGTARCFDLDLIGSFLHFERVKSGYVSSMLVSINGGEDGLNLHLSLPLGWPDFTTLYANEKEVMCGFILNFILIIHCLISFGLPAQLKIDGVARIDTVEFVQQGREKFPNLEMADTQGSSYSPQNIIQLDFTVLVEEIDSYVMFCYGFVITSNIHNMIFDLSGTGCFFLLKKTLQFQQWDPGGCCCSL